MSIALIVFGAWIALSVLVLGVLAARADRALRHGRQAHFDRVARFAAGEWDDELAPLRARRAGAAVLDNHRQGEKP